MDQLEHAAAGHARTAEGFAAQHVAGSALRNGWRCEPFGSSASGIELHAWWPTMRRPTRVLSAAIHGEETSTLQLAQHLLRCVHADDACAVVVPVLNPDGVLACTRQNARGVDLNRNFPTADWQATPSRTYWPTTTTRTAQRRTQLSSPGSEPGSEPETQAIMGLIERVEPELVIDLHAPLECLIARSDAAFEVATHLAEPAGLPIVRELQQPTPGDAATWCAQQGITAVTYEVESDVLARLWSRHETSLAHCIVERRR